MKKFIALLLAAVMVLAMCACGQTAAPAAAPAPAAEAPAEAAPAAEAPAEEAPAAEAAPDTITVMVPPVTNGYGDMIKAWAEEWKVDHPNITVDVIETTWDDHNQKLSTMAMAGEAPDISEIAYNALGSYVEMGVAVDLTKYIDVSDYDANALGYLTLDNTLFGLPLYVTIQALGGNKAMLEEAGVDVAKVQSEGWTYDEFLAALEAGTKDGVFGFVFANQGITTSDFINIFGGAAGLTNAFTGDLKYAFTSENMLNLLKAIEEIIGSGYMPNYTVAAGDRLKMLQKGETMVTGKAMPLFENNVRTSSEAAAAGPTEEGYIEMEYVFLTVPTMENVAPNCYGQVDGLMPFLNSNSTDEHLKNVCEFLDFICSGSRVADLDNTLLLPCVSATGREAQKSAELVQSEGNATAAALGISLVVTPPAGVTAEQSANANQLMNEVIVPKLEALIAGEASAEAVYEAICDAAFAAFGEAGCETGFIG